MKFTARVLLQRLTQLRLASIGVWVVFLYYLQFNHFHTPYAWELLALYVSLLGVGAWQAWRGQVQSWHLLAQIVVECQLFAVLLFVSGGAANPLISYYLILLVMAAYSLSHRQAIAVTVLTVLDYSVLTQWHLPLLAAHSSTNALFDLHLAGMWLTFVLSAFILVLLIPVLVQSREQQRQEIQQLRERQLKNEQLIGIATLAAGTAHEMGTPLMTMQMLLNELPEQQSLGAADLAILSTQVSRCRDALKRLSQAGRMAKDSGLRPANLWLEGVLQRWRLSHPKAQWQDLELSDNAMVPASSLLDQALLNLLDNAAEAGSLPIQLKTEVSEKCWLLTIVQPDTRAALTLQPTHEFTSQKEHGMGLGMYVSNASVEQFGGTIHLHAQADGSSVCQLRLPLGTTPCQNVC